MIKIVQFIQIQMPDLKVGHNIMNTSITISAELEQRIQDLYVITQEIQSAIENGEYKNQKLALNVELEKISKVFNDIPKECHLHHPLVQHIHVILQKLKCLQDD